MSREVTVTIGGEEFSFPTHRIGHSYDSALTVNVKVYATAKPVSESARAAYALLPDEQQQALVDQAWSNCQEMWWDDAADKAKELALGDILSEGRCGGWLVLNDWPRSKLEELAESEDADACYVKRKTPGGEAYCNQPHHAHRDGDLFLSPWCGECGEERSAHVGGHCPFLPGSTYAGHRFQSDALDTVRRIEAFFKWCELTTDESSAQEALNDQLEFLLTENDYWQEAVASARAAAAPASGRS